MSRKIIGVTVGTPTSPAKIKHDIEPEIKEYVDTQLGDLDAALDAILAMFIPHIAFTVGGTECTAIEGMTWGEWCESDYNTIGAYIQDTLVRTNEERAISIDLIAVKRDEVINSGVNYDVIRY